METLFLRVVWLSATVSAVLLPLLLASRWLQSRVKAKSLYILWLLLAVRLVVPVEITLPKPAVTVQVPQYEVTIPTNRPSEELPNDQLSPVEPNVEPSLPQMEQEPDLTAQTEVPVAVVLGTLWLTGVFAIALIQISSYLVTRRALLRWARPVSPETREQIQYLALRLGLKRTFQVRRSDRVRTAMVLGVLRPVLLIPQEECDPLVVLHELNHLRRRDLEYKGLMMAACWLLWFNPLVWWMSRVAGRNLELCCDEDVAGKENSAFRHRYGRLLLECAAEGAGPVLSSRFGSSKEELKARLTNLFVVKKRGRALVCLALACAVLVGGLVACEQTQNGGPDQAVEELENTITYDGQTVSFTLPEGKRDWSLHIAGRAEVEWLGGMSLHYLDETAWTPGETYSFDLDGESVGDITELSMYIDLEGQSYTVDLLPHVREYSKPYPYYHNYDYGFTLTLPEGWAEGVDIQEMDGGVDFYMKSAGDWDGAGWLVGIYLTDPTDWQGIADAGCPHGQRFLGQTAQGVLYAIGPSDVRYDETVPGEMERYNALYERVGELLDSFQLDSIHALVQEWLEDRVKQGPPEGTQGYDYLDGRVQCLSFQRMELGYAVYEIEYRFLVDHPENVVVAGGMELDEEGWLRDYSMTAYLIVRNGSIVGLRISDISPEYPLFWYELPDLSEEEKWQAMAQVAYAGAEEWMQLYQGYIGGTGECAFSREELAQAGYQAQTLPEQWKLVRGGGYPQNRNELLGAFQFYFSDALAQRMVDEMLSGPDAPFLFYEGALYFRDDVPCGEKIDGMYTDWSWSSFTITDRVEKGFEGIEFTLSDNAAMNGDSAGKTWTFRLVLDEGYSVRFYCWFNLE